MKDLKEQILVNNEIKKMVSYLEKKQKISNFKFYENRPMKKLKSKILIVTVGPPARGKSFLGNYIRDDNPDKIKIFNSGKKRREKGYAGADSSFFQTEKGKNLLDEWAMETLDDACIWLLEPYKKSNVSSKLGWLDRCAIFDATNSTLERRNTIYEQTNTFLRENKSIGKVSVLFIEMLCPNPVVVHYNMLMKVLTSPDYKNKIEDDIKADISLDKALSKSIKDIKQRDKNYLKRYKILSLKEKKKYDFIQFIIPSCTVRPSKGIINTNIQLDTWIIKKIKNLPKAIVTQTLEGYSSYK